MAQLVKNLPAIREAWVRSLGWEDPLEKGKAAHPSIPESSMVPGSQGPGLPRSSRPWGVLPALSAWRAEEAGVQQAAWSHTSLGPVGSRLEAGPA